MEPSLCKDITQKNTTVNTTFSRQHGVNFVTSNLKPASSIGKVMPSFLYLHNVHSKKKKKKKNTSLLLFLPHEILLNPSTFSFQLPFWSVTPSSVSIACFIPPDNLTILNFLVCWKKKKKEKKKLSLWRLRYHRIWPGIWIACRLFQQSHSIATQSSSWLLTRSRSSTPISSSWKRRSSKRKLVLGWRTTN